MTWIYPDVPMWMKIIQTGSGNFHYLNGWFENLRPYSCVYALNGELYLGVFSVGLYGGMYKLNFIEDSCYRYNHAHGYGRHAGKHTYNIANRQTGGGTYLGFVYDASLRILSSEINDIAVKVLPNAPIDAITGLPIATVAVATNGGVSIVKDDKTITNSAITTSSNSVCFTDDYSLIQSYSAYVDVYLYKNPTYLSDGFNYDEAYNRNESPIFAPKTSVGFSTSLTGTKESFIRGSSTGIDLYIRNINDKAKGVSCHITAKYNTGWMNNALACWLCSNELGNLSSDETLYDPQNSGWYNVGAYATNNDDGSFTVTNNASYRGRVVTKKTIIKYGKSYAIKIDIVSTTGTSVNVVIGDRNANNNHISRNAFIATLTTTGTHNILIKSRMGVNTGDAYVGFFVAAGGSHSFTLKDLRIFEIDSDRSIEDMPFSLVGTITKEPVAPGAELMAYGNWGSDNYMVQPYNPKLDVGSGDFWCRSWGIINLAAVGTFIQRGGVVNSSELVMYHDTSGNVFFRVKTSTNGLTATSAVRNGLTRLDFLRRDGVIYIYVNGIEVASKANTESVNQNSPLYTGRWITNGGLANSGKLLFAKFESFAPTAEQIKKMYESEKKLFQPKAKCCLTSNKVNDLSYDKERGLLYASTYEGTDVFQDLLKVDHIPGEAKAVSAVDGSYVVSNDQEAVVHVPPVNLREELARLRVGVDK